jgi:hypothetical protein
MGAASGDNQARGKLHLPQPPILSSNHTASHRIHTTGIFTRRNLLKEPCFRHNSGSGPQSPHRFILQAARQNSKRVVANHGHARRIANAPAAAF